MKCPLADAFEPEALVLIVHGPVLSAVVISSAKREAVIEAYQHAGVEVEIVAQRQVAS